MNITNSLRKLTVASMFAMPVLSIPISAQKDTTKDSFEYSIPAQGTDNIATLNSAPSPLVIINGKEQNAVIVVDISKNILYKYDDGIPVKAYKIASGKASTPTHTGVRIVTHVETYPYKSAPVGSKRRRNPRAYGPKIICLNKINPENGEQAPTGEFIHGNNNPSSIGKYASHGCMRMDNEVIKELSSQVKQGDIVIIRK